MLARGDKPSVRQHHVGGKQIVDRKPVAPRQVADAAPKRQAAHAGRADDSTRRGKPERVGRMIDVAPLATPFHANGARGRVDADTTHRRKVDYQAVVAGAETAAVVPAAPHGQQQRMLAREVHGCDHVRDIRATRDQPRALRNHRVVDLARIVIGGVARLDERSPKGRTIRRQIGRQIVVAEHFDLLDAFLMLTLGRWPTAGHPQD